jgi:hypothetical protein
MKGKIITLSLVIAVLIEGAIMTLYGTAHAQSQDPTPRIEYLGTEKISTPYDNAPARAHFFRDKATHTEIVCFSGMYRETLSCMPTGRTR